MKTCCIDGVSYQKEESESEFCFKRCDAARKWAVELHIPKSADNGPLISEITETLANLYIDSLLAGGQNA